MRPPPTPPNGTEAIWIGERRRHAIGRCANWCSEGGGFGRAEIWRPRSTKPDRRRSSETWQSALARLRRGVRPSGRERWKLGRRQACSKRPPSPFRTGSRAKGAPSVRRSGARRSSSRSRQDARTHSSRKWSVRFFRPGCIPQLYSPTTKTNASAVRIFAASASMAAGAEPARYSLYIRSRMGRPTLFASMSSTVSPRARNPATMKSASRIPIRSERYDP